MFDLALAAVVTLLGVSFCQAGAPSKYSTRSQIFRWDVGLTGAEGKLAAFTDFNNDKYADVVLHTPNAAIPSYTDVKVFVWSKTSFTFGLIASITVPLEVVNIIPADFNKDGSIDLLVQGTSEAYSDQLVSQIYLGHVNSLSTDFCQDIQFISNGQVLLFDYNSDMRVDILGSTDNSTRTVWENVDFPSAKCGFKFQAQIWSLSSGITSFSQSNSFVDLDGNCLSDLFLSTQSGSQTIYELFLNQKGSWKANAWSESNQHFLAPQGAGIVTFMDVDGDGNLDAVFPVCVPAETCTQSSIHIIFNVQQTICETSKGSDGCRNIDDLCVSDPNFQLGSIVNSRDYISVSLPNQRGMRFTTSKDFSDFNFRVQPGDINLDGYPDLLVFVSYEVDGQQQHGAVALANVACDSDACFPEAISAGRRYFSKMAASTTGDLETIHNVYAGAFFDLDDDGTQDIVLLTKDPNTDVTSTIFLVNNFNEDAFFLKSIGLNGVCPSHCTTGNTFPNPKPYGASCPGAVTKFYVTDLDGQYLPRTSVQLSQSSHSSLNTPYAMFGLGRTNNYIEKFYMGFPDAQGSAHFYVWPGMIPNSQILVFPYSEDKPSSWTLELVISPSDSVVYVIIALSSCVAILCVTIGIFHWKEKQQDEAEKKKQDHFFTF